jgi:8-oxo-dGTP diphosphatase
MPAQAGRVKPIRDMPARSRGTAQMNDGFNVAAVSWQWRVILLRDVSSGIRVSMKASKKPEVVLAAGGIVVRDAPEPLIAIVQLRKDKAWVLPKGKLRPNEEALAAARREVMEETGHEVSIHQFLGSMSHASRGRLKVVQFWHMRAAGEPARKLMDDVKAVKWLPLDSAISSLTHTEEKVFLANAGPAALNPAGTPAAPLALPPTPSMAPARTIGSWLRRIANLARAPHAGTRGKALD